MKYLKKFNELKSQTYTKAAKALKSLGHTRRAAAMTDYVATVEERERIQKIKEKRETYAHTGVFRASIVFESFEGAVPNRTLKYVSPLKKEE
jgi:TnpA family transposase